MMSSTVNVFMSFPHLFGLVIVVACHKRNKMVTIRFDDVSILPMNFFTYELQKKLKCILFFLVFRSVVFITKCNKYLQLNHAQPEH